jgi:hypothetical protein
MGEERHAVGDLGDQLKDTKVDLDQFQSFVEYARVIQDWVHFELVGQTLAPQRWMSFENDNGNPFGNFDEAARLKQSVVESRASLTARVREVETRIGQLHHALEEIAKNYRNVEELNRADADKIKALLSQPVVPSQPAL